MTPRDCDIEGVDVFGDRSLQVVKDDRKLCLLGRGNASWEWLARSISGM